MYCNDDFATERDNGIVISVYNELLNEKAVGDEFCWGYYLRIENNSPDKISLLGRKISITDVKGRQVSVASEVFEFEDYATSKASAVLCGSCKIANGRHEIKDIRLPVLSLIANDNGRVLN